MDQKAQGKYTLAGKLDELLTSTKLIRNRLQYAAMRIILVTLVVVLTLLLIGCKSPNSIANQNAVSIGGGKKLSPKEELLGHWTTPDKVR